MEFSSLSGNMEQTQVVTKIKFTKLLVTVMFVADNQRKDT